MRRAGLSTFRAACQVSAELPGTLRPWGLAHFAFADRFRGKANVIDRVDLPGYGASDAHMQDDASGTLSVPLVNVAAVYFGRTRPAECSMPLARISQEG